MSRATTKKATKTSHVKRSKNAYMYFNEDCKKYIWDNLKDQKKPEFAKIKTHADYEKMASTDKSRYQTEKNEEKKHAPPKGKQSSYQFFSNAVRTEVCEELGTKKIPEVSKEISARWKKLKADAEKGDKKAKKQLEEYEKLAALDKERHTKAKEQYDKEHPVEEDEGDDEDEDEDEDDD